MKPLKIFIDYMYEDKDFGLKLKKQLKSIVGSTEIFDYFDLDDSDTHEDWVDITIEAIHTSDIIIPILASDYISGLIQEQKLNLEFDKAVDSDNKFVFPILFKPTDWSSQNWIVKSTMIPSDAKPLSKYSDNDKERVINDLVKTIKNIAVNHQKTLLPNKKLKSQNLDKNTIFISHDHDDADFADLLKLRLEKNGLNAWIDSERLKIGQDWREEIDQGIEDSIAVIAIMTPDARKSEYVTYEWAFAWEKAKKYFPLCLNKRNFIQG